MSDTARPAAPAVAVPAAVRRWPRIASIGFAAGLMTGRPGAALAGFFCLGLGLALVVPAVFSAAGRIPGLHPGTAVATVPACGWAGFVCGPPLIGRLASLTSLPAALGLLPLLTAFIVVGTSLARALKARPQSNGRPDSAGVTRRSNGCSSSTAKSSAPATG